MNIIEAQGKYFSGDVALSLFNIVGSPGSGKTVFANFIIKRLSEELGRDNIYYIKTRDIRDAFKEINPNKEYQVFFIDDAGKEQASRDSMQNKAIYQDLPDIRHIAQDIHDLEEGRVIILLCSHVPKHLDLIIRNFEKFRFYKDMNLTESQTKEIINNLYPQANIKNKIGRWVDKVNMEDPDALSKVFVVRKSGRYAFINFEPVEDPVEPDKNLISYSIPDREGSESSENYDQIEYSGEDLEELLDQVLEDLKKDPDYSKEAKVLDRSLNTPKSNLEIAEDLDLKEGSINYYKNKAMGELKRRAGLEYEKIVAQELEEMNYKEISRMGGTGEPDILALDPEGKEVAVSVKLYDYARPRHTLDSEEFRPELEYIDKNEALAYLWYTNLSWSSGSGETYLEDISNLNDRVVIKKGEGVLVE